MKLAKDLTDQELEALIAEVCGWRRWKTHRPGKVMSRWKSPKGAVVASHPHYCRCLNAIHKAWETLPPSQRDAYEGNLYGVVIGQADYNRNDDAPYITNALARQRAEAFAITKDLALP